MLKTIKLGLAERQIISLVLANGVKADIGTARIVRALRRDLRLREASRDVDEMNTEAMKAAKAGDESARLPTWDDLLDEEQAEYTADDTNLRSLQEWLTSFDFSRQRNEDGREKQIGVAPALLEAAANAADAIADALVT